MTWDNSKTSDWVSKLENRRARRQPPAPRVRTIHDTIRSLQILAIKVAAEGGDTYDDALELVNLYSDKRDAEFAERIEKACNFPHSISRLRALVELASDEELSSDQLQVLIYAIDDQRKAVRLWHLD